MKYATPLSTLAELLAIDISKMNRADAQDAVCTAASERLTMLIQQPLSLKKQWQAEAFDSPVIESSMKAGCIGEISFTIENGNVCPECWSGNVSEGESCELCMGESDEDGYSDLTVEVPWTVQKEIFKKMCVYKAATVRESNYPEIPDSSVGINHA